MKSHVHTQGSFLHCQQTTNIKKNTFHEDYNDISGDNKDLRETSFVFSKFFMKLRNDK